MIEAPRRHGWALPLLLLLVLAAAVAAAACSDAPNTWQQIFDRASAAEQDCMRRSEGPLLALYLDREVAPVEGVETWAASLYACLTPDSARAVFLDTSLRYLQDAFGERLDQDIEDCWRGHVAEADVVGAFAFEVFGIINYGAPAGTPFPDLKIGERRPGSGQQSLMRALPHCAPELVRETLLKRFNLMPAELTQAERDCVAERAPLSNIPALIAPEPNHSLGLMAAEGILSECTPRLYLPKLFDLHGVEPFVFDTAQLDCAADTMAELAQPVLNASPVLAYWQASSLLWYVLAHCWEDQLLDARGDDPPDDHPDERDGTAVTVGERVEAVLSGTPDVDWFHFDGEQGAHYTIEIRVVNDTQTFVLAFLEDSNFTDLAHVYEVVEADGFSIYRMILNAPETDQYLLAVGAVTFRPVSYMLTINAEIIEDDHGDIVEDATVAEVGELIIAKLEFDNDVDVFVFDAVADRIYLIETTLETLYSSKLRLEDEAGKHLVRDDYDDEPGSASIVWTAPESGRYTVQLSGAGRGSYTFAIWEAPDDHANTVAQATAIGLESSAQGAIDYAGDADVFVLEAEQGVYYEIRVELGTLSDSDLQLSDSQNATVALNDDDGDSLASRLRWRAVNSGLHYITVGGYGTGTYTLSTTQIDLTDAFGATDDETALLELGVQTKGALDYSGDYNGYVFAGVAGETYTVVVYLYSLEDVLVEVSDRAGCPAGDCATAEDKRIWSGPESALVYRTTWVAPTTGGQYVYLTGPGAGRYAVVVARTDPDAEAAE